MSGLTASDILSGVHADIKDGQIKGSAASSVSKATEAADKKSGGALDKDAFLQLLVTQMKYQDPLEPQDNSEMVSQLATFSSLEEMQNVSASMDKARASGWVGQVVSIEHTDEATGNTSSIEGVVDFVSFQGSSIYVSVEGELYPVDEVASVVDQDYTVAVKLADAFVATLNKLPSMSGLNSTHLETIEGLMAGYSQMDSYQKSMLNSDAVALYNNYASWYAINGSMNADMNKLGPVNELTSDKFEDVKTLVNKYNSYSDVQRSVVSADILRRYNDYLAWYSKEQDKTDGDAAPAEESE